MRNFLIGAWDLCTEIYDRYIPGPSWLNDNIKAKIALLVIVFLGVSIIAIALLITKPILIDKIGFNLVVFIGWGLVFLVSIVGQLILYHWR